MMSLSTSAASSGDVPPKERRAESFRFTVDRKDAAMFSCGRAILEGMVKNGSGMMTSPLIVPWSCSVFCWRNGALNE